MKKILSLCLFALALVLSGCASGPKYQEVKASLPSLSKDKGRIYFFRSSSPFGAAMQPSVMLNGEKVGDAVPGGMFFVDRAPGNYTVSTSTEVEKNASFTLEAGQERFVKLSIGFGVIAGRVIPELVDKNVAESEMAGLSYTGGSSSK